MIERAAPGVGIVEGRDGFEAGRGSTQHRRLAPGSEINNEKIVTDPRLQLAAAGKQFRSSNRCVDKACFAQAGTVRGLPKPRPPTRTPPDRDHQPHLAYRAAVTNRIDDQPQRGSNEISDLDLDAADGGP